MRQKKIKSRIIAGIIALLAILAIIRINIEPSDYQKAIAEKVETAVELYQKAESGNEDGMYSWYTLGMFKSEIVKAKNRIRQFMRIPGNFIRNSKKPYPNLKSLPTRIACRRRRYLKLRKKPLMNMKPKPLRG